MLRSTSKTEPGHRTRIDYSMRLPDGEFLPAMRKKFGIALHHTVGRTAASTSDHSLNDKTERGQRRMVGTAFIIGRDGTAFQIFDPTAWTFQFGLRWPEEERWKFEQRFISIELASDGAIREFDGRLYYFDRILPKTVKPLSEAADYGSPYRGYRFFDRYEPALIDSLCR